MKTCKPYELLLSRSLDDDLNLKEQKKLKEHLRSCPACRQKARWYLQMRSGFSQKQEAHKSQLYLVWQQSLVADDKPKQQINKKTFTKLFVFRKPAFRYYSGAAALFMAVFLLFFNSDTNNALENNALPRASLLQNNENNYMLAVDYPMAGILAYEEDDTSNEAKILDSYTEAYTPRLNSYFNYVGFEK